MVCGVRVVAAHTVHGPTTRLSSLWSRTSPSWLSAETATYCIRAPGSPVYHALTRRYCAKPQTDCRICTRDTSLDRPGEAAQQTSDGTRRCTGLDLCLTHASQAVENAVQRRDHLGFGPLRVR